MFVSGWPDIGRMFGATGKAAREWYSMGAPILCLGEKPITEPQALWQWLLENRQAVEQGGLSADAMKRQA